VGNRIFHFLFKYIQLLLFILITNSPVILAQKKGYVIGVDKTFIDANDPLYKPIKPGDTLYFSSGYRMYINISNFKGTFNNPIVITNTGGDVIIDTDNYYGISIQNCQYIKFTGSGYPGQYYGFKIKRVSGGAGMGIGYLSSDIEIDHISIENTLIGGLYAKTDPDCTMNSVRGTFTQYNTVIHDNYIANTGDEGIYVGSTKYFGQTINCNGKDTLLMPCLLDGVKIYNNTIQSTGWDGIQVSSASKNCQIYDNTILYDSQKKDDSQMSGILIGGGTKCDCYNNFIFQGNGDGIDCLGLGGTRLFNNIIVDAGQSYLPTDKTKMKHGIFVSDISIQKDSSFDILHNNIIHPKSDGIRFSSVISKGNVISSNVIIDPGNYDYYETGNTSFKGKDSYIMFQTPGSATTLSNNYLARNAASVGFMSQKMQLPADFNLVMGSPLIDAADYNFESAVSFDFLHHPRPYGLKSDIGAFEYEGITSYIQLQTDTITKRSWLIQNPVTNILKVCLPAEPGNDLVLGIYNLQGAIESETNQSQIEDGLRIFEINVSKLSGGVHIYSIRTKKNNYSGKFLKL